MLILAINTASSKTAIALLENMEIIAEDSWDAENREAEKLMPAIHELLKKKNKNYTDIDEIYAIKGPGSFTGLRVGVTVANTLAYLLNCQLFGISTFEYWH
ncbi:MAG: tRNA (adenosine(37)-N6)-threonylcarbamoyltransferase complex dimerization subunit type 1 TsaB, partial [Patescibacteria group bacterium]